MTALHHAIGNEVARWSRVAAVTALVCMPLATLPAQAAWQPYSTWTSDRTAYDHAVAVGTTSALRDFLMAYPDSPLANKALELLVQHCTILKPQANGMPTTTGNNVRATTPPSRRLRSGAMTWKSSRQ